MNSDAISNEQFLEDINLSKNLEIAFFLFGICGWLWDCVVYLPKGNTLADNGSAVSGVVTKERFPDHSMLYGVFILIIAMF